MHRLPDLNLASSYIPACLCVLKCTAVFVLFIFSPVRGWIGMGCLILVDRILWNQHHTTILDVNAVAVALVGGLMVMHSRADGLHSVLHVAVTAVWMLVSAPQIVGVSRIHRSYEVILGACCVTILSCLYQTQERTELLALRAFVFVVANVTLPYLGVMMQQHEIDTYVNACRTMLILLGTPEVACAWMVTYMLCIGYQIRGCPKRPAQSLQQLEELASVAVHSSKPSPPMPSMNNPPSLIHEQHSSSDEAALLREALASRRGFNRDS
jgi:uncharacterized membrane protein